MSRGFDAEHDEMYKLEQEPDSHGGGDPENFFEDEEDSPYPEVRASVSNFDDPEMPCLTFRAMLLGISFTLLGAAANTYFYLRYPAPLLTPIVVQIITYPLGAGLARILPVTLYDTPKWLQKIGAPSYWSLNPGPFNIKEHSVIIIMANVSIAPSFTQSMLLALDKFYEIKTGFGYDILLLLSVNTVGFSFAGFCRRFLIWPAALIWPQTLVTCTLLNTFHAEDDDAASGSLTRYRYFLYVFFGALVWYIVPGYLFIGLSAFSWVCWIAPSKSNITHERLWSLQLIRPFSFASQSRRQSALWRCYRSRHEQHNLRLVTNCIHRFASNRTLVGYCKYLRWLHCPHLAFRAYHVLYQCENSTTILQTISH